MATINQPKGAWHHLLQNHADAWIVTFIIGCGVILLHDTFSLSAVLLVFSLTGGYWLAFALNDYFDQEVDGQDPRKRGRNFFTLTSVTSQKATRGFVIASLIIAPGMLQFGWRGFFASLICVFIMWAYSAPPLRFKSRPGIDLPIHALFVETFPYVLVMYLLNLAWEQQDYVILGLGLMASLTAQLEQQLRDVEIDGVNGEVTFTLWLGVDRALILLKVISVVMVVYGLTFTFLTIIPLWIAPIGLAAVPAVLSRLKRQPGESRPEHLIRPVVYFGIIYILMLIGWRLFV